MSRPRTPAEEAARRAELKEERLLETFPDLDDFFPARVAELSAEETKLMSAHVLKRAVKATKPTDPPFLDRISDGANFVVIAHSPGKAPPARARLAKQKAAKRKR